MNILIAGRFTAFLAQVDSSPEAVEPARVDLADVA